MCLSVMCAVRAFVVESVQWLGLRPRASRTSGALLHMCFECAVPV